VAVNDAVRALPPMTTKVLHAVGRMGVGGVENWLRDVLRRTDPAHVLMDFLVHADLESEYAREIESLGGRLQVVPSHRDRLAYLLALSRLMGVERYDVVHSHLDHYAAMILAIAARQGVPVRIAHSHVAESVAGYSWPRLIYRRLAKTAISLYATRLVACSESAALNLFGAYWSRDPRTEIIHYGIDVHRAASSTRAEFRAELDLPAGAVIIGTAVRFTAQKNLLRWVDIAAVLAERRDDVLFVMAGDGPDMAAVVKRVSVHGLEGRFRFPGSRDDVMSLLAELFDVVLLPSLYEGLPILLIEAQAAGVPAVCSTAVSDEIVAFSGLVHRLSLDESNDRWADEVLNLVERDRVDQRVARSAMQGTSFDIETSVASVLQLYGCKDARRSTG